MRHLISWGICLTFLFAIPVYAQTIEAGFSGGFTYLGGLKQVLQVDSHSAISGSLFLDFDVGAGIDVRLGANFANAGDKLFSSFETNLLWNFPLGKLRGFAGGGIGLFGMPVDISPAIHMSLQGLIGMENNAWETVIVKITLQALQVLKLNHGFVPGNPLFRIEVGITLPFQA